jgi:hypothetical protein
MLIAGAGIAGLLALDYLRRRKSQEPAPPGMEPMREIEDPHKYVWKTVCCPPTAKCFDEFQGKYVARSFCKDIPYARPAGF